MSEAFNPYHAWLGIPPEEQPPNHYRLLGVALFEVQAEVIDTAADRQMAHLRTFQCGKHSALSQRLLNEVSAARLCLLNSAKRGRLRPAAAQAVCSRAGRNPLSPRMPRRPIPSNGRTSSPARPRLPELIVP